MAYLTKSAKHYDTKKALRLIRRAFFNGYCFSVYKRISNTIETSS